MFFFGTEGAFHTLCDTRSESEKEPGVKSAQDPFHSVVIHIERYQAHSDSLSQGTVDSLYCGHPCVHSFLSTVDRVSTLRRVMNINELGQKVLKVKVVSSVNSLDLGSCS